MPPAFVLFLWFCILGTHIKAAAYDTINYSTWNSVVSSHIHPGTKDNININLVDYIGISKDKNYLLWLDNVANITKDSWVSNVTDNIYDFYSFFINVYNTFTISTIINNPCKDINVNGTIICKPITSIWEISPNVFNLNQNIIAGSQYSLNQVEDYLRNPSTFINKNSSWIENPLVHSTIVCGGVSCPNVQPWAFGYNNGTQNVYNDMTVAMTEWLTNTKKGLQLIKNTNTLILSKIFSWDAQDFQQFNETVPQYLLPYMPSEDQSYVSQHLNTIQLEYFDYDWTLNGNPPCYCS